ncbi:MAG: hypothetical protein ACRC6M_01225 [Microcystaceae cyanobacterium]
MSENPRTSEMYREIAELKRRISKLEYGMQELDNVVDPKGWIGEAFKILEEDVDENFERVHQELRQLNSKIDIILQHITGFSRGSETDSNP